MSAIGEYRALKQAADVAWQKAEEAETEEEFTAWVVAATDLDEQAKDAWIDAKGD